MEAVVFLLLSGVISIGAAPVQPCAGGQLYVADDSNLCRFYRCIADVDEPIELACPPGARVPTWFVSSPNNDVAPCSLDHSADMSCLRCDYADVPPPDNERGNCNPNPCPPECPCQDLWNSYYCLCPGGVITTFETVTSGAFFCDPDPCRNGATCYSQWDDYWCQCPRGYTGKNCEVPFCEPNPCMNGGVCTIDNISYYCSCTQCFDGPCCESRITNVAGCEQGIVPPPTVGPPTVGPPTAGPPTAGPPTAGPPSTARPPVTTQAPCTDCQYGDRCQFARNELCRCNPCPSAGELCYDREAPYDRECLGKPSTQGSQYTMTFSQDSGSSSSTHKRVYVHGAGSDPDGGTRRVRIYTPNLQPADPCYVDVTVLISLNDPAYYDVPAECLNTESGEVEDSKVLRVVDLNGLDLIVTVSNMDGDGYLAIPDANAGQHYITHSYSRSGSQQYITIVALSDSTQVSIQRPDEEQFVGTTTDSGIVTFQLNALQSVRYLYRDLAGSVVVSNADIHVWSGNMDENSQKTIEQLPAVTTWGATASNDYTYIVLGIANEQVDTVDDVHMQTAVETRYSLFRVSNNRKVQEVTNGLAAANADIYLGSLGVDEAFEIVTSEPVQVTHSIRAQAPNGQNYYSSYTLIPAVELFAQSYSFQTHGERGNVGSDFTRHYLALVSLRNVVADVPDYFEQILFYHYNTETGVNTTFTPQQLGATWMPITGSYWGAIVELPSQGVYYLSNPSLADWSFGAIYYAVSGTSQSEMPNAAFPLGYDMTMFNDVPQPVLCERCTTGPNCAINIINTCVCNPCENFDDQCTDSNDPSVPRVCVSTADTTGNPFTLMYMQNRPDNTDKRELEIYVTSAGTGSRPVRVYTPTLSSSDPCYFNISRVIRGFEVSLFTIPDAGCFETIGSGIFNDKSIRVQSDDGQDLLVYAINRDQFSADGWVAFPDIQAGTDHYTVSHDPPVYGSEFGVVNIQDVPVNIDITYTGRATPNLAGNTFLLNPGYVLQIQSDDDLSGTRIQSDRPVNVYSGNIRARVEVVEDPQVGNIDTGSRDHLVEQLLPVSKWGKVFHIEPIPDRRFGDQLKVVGQTNTACTLYRRQPDGLVTDESFGLTSGLTFTRDVVSDNTYRLSCDRKVFVAQITKSQERGSNIHDPSLITVPPVEQYSNRYIFNTPLFSGGANQGKRPYQFRILLISARDEDRSGITIVYNGTFTTVSSLGTWTPVPQSNYYNIAVDLQEGTSIIFHPEASVEFMCIFYGYDDRESLGFPIGMKLSVIED